VTEQHLVSCLTPAGRSALATVAVYGPDAWNLISSLIREHQQAPAPGNFLLARIGGDVSERAVVVRRQSTVEVHCHGGPALTRMLIDLLRARGAREVSWKEWLTHTSPSPIRAAAAVALAEARTLRTANILLDQHQGCLDRALAELAGRLEQEDVPRSHELLAELQHRIPLGLHLVRPWRVVVAGPPNAGKSTLLNRLLGYERAITSPLPGTTRDVVTAVTALEGWPIDFMDTAGIRANATGLEAAGIERAHAVWRDVDLRVWLLDRDQAVPAHPPAVDDLPLVLALNKTDLPARDWERGLPIDFRLSALTGEGVADLARGIVQQLVPAPPEGGTPVPFTEALAEGLRQAQSLLDSRDLLGAGTIVRGLLTGDRGRGCESSPGRVD
jgi:tRNA modification GTPase